MTLNTELIPFHGATLIYFERDGVPFVAIRPICETLGVDIRGQIAKLKARSAVWGAEIISAPSAGGTQETYCLPINRVAAWLFSITPSRVAEHLREALTLYQIEAADVLDRHFRLRQEAEHERISLLESMLTRSNASLLASKSRWMRIKAYHDGGLWWSDAARQMNLSETVFSAEIREMQLCGILPAGGWQPGNDAEPDWFDRMQFLQLENRHLKARLVNQALEASEAADTPGEPDDAHGNSDEA